MKLRPGRAAEIKDVERTLDSIASDRPRPDPRTPGGESSGRWPSVKLRIGPLRIIIAFGLTCAGACVLLSALIWTTPSIAAVSKFESHG